MTDRAQFEAMLEALINEDQETAKEIFHNIVVGKSREIYEELLAEDFSKDQGNPYGSEEEEEEEEEEGFDNKPEEEEGEEEEEGGEDDAEDNPFGGEDDAEDDGEETPEFGDEEGGEEGGDIEDRVMDLEDALEDLKAEFEQLLQGEEHEEEQNPDIHGHELDSIPGFTGGDEQGGAGEVDELATMMEYVNKVAAPKHGDNGTKTKSVIDNMKNDMGGTTANIAKNFSTTSGGTQGGLLKPTAGDLTAGLGNIQNRPDAKAGKTGFKTQVKDAHGAEKAGKKETADNKQSMLNGAPKRNK